ncbi:MAG: hypothetical protein ABEJ03_03205 [Candidatus Nanohaloarchaea archaeon]
MTQSTISMDGHRQAHQEAKNLRKHLSDRFDNTTVTMYESPAQENEVEVEVPQCPECGEGIVVSERPRSYPMALGVCKGCDEKYDFKGDSR